MVDTRARDPAWPSPLTWWFNRHNAAVPADGYATPASILWKYLFRASNKCRVISKELIPPTHSHKQRKKTKIVFLYPYSPDSALIFKLKIRLEERIINISTFFPPCAAFCKICFYLKGNLIESGSHFYPPVPALLLFVSLLVLLPLLLPLHGDALFR